MKREDEKIIRKRGENGLVIYHNADFREKITEEEIQKKITHGKDSLEWRFLLSISKLKTFTSILGDNYDEVGLALTSVIKEVENDLQEISDYIEKTIGDIVFICEDKGKAWPGYLDDCIVGIGYRPSEGIED